MKYAVEHPDYVISISQHDVDDEFATLEGDEFDDEEVLDADIMVDKSDRSSEDPEEDSTDTVREEDELKVDALFDEDRDPEVLGPPDDCNEDNEPQSTVVIYTVITGKIAVPQHIHYAHRGLAFEHYNLFEFASIVDVVPKKKENNVNLNSYFRITDSNVVTFQANSNSRRAGRPANGCFQFAESHPLFATHEMRLRSKTKVPVPKYVPKPPPKKPAKLTEAWKKQARNFAKYFLVLFRPWR